MDFSFSSQVDCHRSTREAVIENDRKDTHPLFHLTLALFSLHRRVQHTRNIFIVIEPFKNSHDTTASVPSSAGYDDAFLYLLWVKDGLRKSFIWTKKGMPTMRVLAFHFFVCSAKIIRLTPSTFIWTNPVLFLALKLNASLLFTCNCRPVRISLPSQLRPAVKLVSC